MRFTRTALLLSLSAAGFGCGSNTPAAGIHDAGDGSTPRDGGGGGDTFRITTAALSNGRVGTAYSDRIMAENGTPPYKFVLASGSAVPNGLVLALDGTVVGTPVTAGSQHFDVTVTDSAASPRMASATIMLTIDPAQGQALAITTTMLADGKVGMAYSAHLSASGGTAPYVFSVASGSPPEGVDLGTDGLLSGTASVAGVSSFTVEVTDASNPEQTASAQLTLTIDPATGTVLKITTATLPGGTIGVAYTATLAATGGTPPYQWDLIDGTSLPSGLTLSVDGKIDGTPTEAGTKAFTVQVSDASNPAQASTAQLMITIAPANGAALAITTASLPNGTQGRTYTATVAASGGTAPYSFTVSSGALPPGIALAGGGHLNGTPSQSGTYAFVLQCTDASNPQQIATRPYSLTIATPGGTRPLVIDTTALPQATAGVAYTAMLAASGGTGPYQWALEPGTTLPPGLMLSSMGQITGTPSIPGRYSFTTAVIDASSPQQNASASLSIVVLAPPGNTLRITSSTLPDANTGVPYRHQLAAAGGTPPYQWSIASGALPPGLSLSAGGLISGTTTISGSFSFNAEVNDAAAPPLVAQATLTLNVLPAGTQMLAIITPGLPRGVTSTPYTAQLAALGGVLPYTWSLASGTLPPGLSLSTSGLISGTPASAGAFTFGVHVVDSGTVMQSASRQLSIIIFANPGSGLQILNQFLHNGDLGRAYTADILVAGGTQPYMLSVVQGSLPPGLALDSGTHTISGTPTMVGAFTFTLRATDSAMPPASAERTYTVTINQNQGVRIITLFLPPAVVNQAYSATLAAIRGTPPYTWSIAQGTLPAGLTLSTGGMISGTPTARGRVDFTVMVTDSGAPPTTATRALSIDVR